MATDNGPASGSPEINIGTAATANIFIEQHVQGPVSTPIASGVPGGLSGPASGLNQLAPADFPGSSAQAYGTVSAGGPVVPIFNAGGTSAFGPNNPAGAGSLSGLFRMKNPA